MKVVVTETAKVSLQEIIDYLSLKWTLKERTTLERDIRKFVQTAQDGILKYPSAENFPEIKCALLSNRQVKVFFEYKDDVILIKLFWHCKQNPEKLSGLLLKKL